MTENDRSLVYRKKISCTCGWEVKFGYGVAFTLAVFEVKRLLVLALEIFAEWQVIRIAGGSQPIAFALADVSLGLPCALITVRTIRRRKSNLPSKIKQILRCLLIMIIVCIAMNTMTLVSIGYHISVKQKTLIDVFNVSMHLYSTVASYKYAIDQIQFMLQCCGHSSYTDWFLFDWQIRKINREKYIFYKKVDYASREEMAGQNRISDEDYRSLGVPFSCCNVHAAAPCMHLEMTDDETINVNGCVEVISSILLRIVIVAYIMTITVIVIQVLLAFLITRMVHRFVPLETSFPRARCPMRARATPFSIINTSSRTYVPRLFPLKKSAWRKGLSMHYCTLTAKDVSLKENRKIRSPKARRRYPILNHGYCTWDVAKIKPSVHEEHRVSVECLRNKCSR